MKYHNLIIDKDEYNSLLRSISVATKDGDKACTASIFKLSAELKSAKIVKNDTVPEDVVRFNSFVTICTSFTTERCYQIVAPEKSDIRQNRISILSPMALALFGYAKNDEICWEFPSGTSIIKIIDVQKRPYETTENKVGY